MKILYKLMILVFASSLFFTSCVDESKYPIGSIATIETFPVAPYVSYRITTSPVLDVTDINNAVYGGTIDAPGKNVASYDLQVRAVIAGSVSDFAPLLTITSFPSDLNITAASIATALGINVSDFPPGTRFDFVGTSTGTDGTVLTYNDLNNDLQVEAGQAQSYNFSTFISCPFVQADALGTYVITNDDGFGLNGITQFEVVAGEDSGQIVMINPFGGNEAYDVVIDVNPFGIATVEEQSAFSTLEQCCAGFEATKVLGDGFVFSCSGAITLNFDTTIIQLGTGGRFTFGPISFSAQKL